MGEARGKAFHDFYAPIEGVAHRFCLCCHYGMPRWIMPAQALPVSSERQIHRGLEMLHKLLKADRQSWRAVIMVREKSDLGAVVEAAEARRAEIYGDLKMEDDGPVAQ